MAVTKQMHMANTVRAVVFRYFQREWRFCVRVALLLIACAGSVLPFVHALAHPSSARQILHSEKANAAGSLWAPTAIMDDDDDDDQQSATNQERFADLYSVATGAFSLTRRQVQVRTPALLAPPVRKIFFPLKLAPPSPASDPLSA